MIKFPDGDELEVMQIGQRKLTMVRDAKGVWIEVEDFRIINPEALWHYHNDSAMSVYDAQVELMMLDGTTNGVFFREVHINMMTNTQALGCAFGDLVDVVKEIGKAIWEVVKG